MDGLILLRQMDMIIEKVSSIYETESVGCSDDSLFLNCVACVRTELQADDVLKRTMQVESRMGRERPYPNAPRTLDIDLLLFNDDIVLTPHLVIPHPRMISRRFVLVPFAEIAPHVVHPLQKKTAASLLNLCLDSHSVEFYCKWPDLHI